MKFRRHGTSGTRSTGLSGLVSFAREVTRGNPWMLTVGGFAVAFLAGYVVAVLFLFPAPIFASEKSVPRVVGMDTENARASLESAGLAAGEVETVPHPTAGRGEVVWQDPPAGVEVPERTAVLLSVSAGPPRVPVPDLAGYDVTLARALLEAAGLQVGGVENTQAPLPRNVVIVTRPPAGTTLAPEAEVTLVVSLGAPTITVPDLRGLELDAARIALEHAGLRVGTYFARASTTGVPGTVIEQNPAGGTLTASETAVNLILARRGVY
jgi:serine/threonine-protein kinase